MGFFSEINKFFKKATREVARVGQQVDREASRVLGKVAEETLRPLSTKSGGLLEPFKSPTIPPLPPLPEQKLPHPATTNVGGQASDEIRRRQRSKFKGRRETIVTGDLTPENVRKTSLLGRTSRG